MRRRPVQGTVPQPARTSYRQHLLVRQAGTGMVMRRKTKVLFMALSMCCMLLINSSYVMAANPDNNFSKMEEKVDGKIYNEKGDVLNLSYIEFKSSCTHASGNRVTDTVWQHRHTGSRCDVYKANATWCKKCNTILKYNSAWVRTLERWCIAPSFHVLSRRI